jgi:hypothetical protein
VFLALGRRASQQGGARLRVMSTHNTTRRLRTRLMSTHHPPGYGYQRSSAVSVIALAVEALSFWPGGPTPLKFEQLGLERFNGFVRFEVFFFDFWLCFSRALKRRRRR